MERTSKGWWGWIRGWPTWVKILVVLLVVWLLLILGSIVQMAITE